MVLPHGVVLIAQPVLLLREPVRLVRSCLGDQVNLEAGLTEHLEGVQGFGDKETWVRLSTWDLKGSGEPRNIPRSLCPPGIGWRERR